MNDAAHMVEMVKGSKSVRFYMTKGEGKVEWSRNCVKQGAISRRVALTKMADYVAKGYRVA